MKRWFRFKDGSIALFEDCIGWFNKPIEVYSSDSLGFGEWIKY